MFSQKSDTLKCDFGVYPLPSESICEMEKHTKFDAGKEEAHFDNIANNYDDIMKIVGYPDPEHIASIAQTIAADKMIARSEAEVADFGCGTGLVGQALN